MKTFYITFGQKYRDEKHPHYPEAHPDGWFEIKARNIRYARDKAFKLLGTYWSFIYSEKEMKKEMFPLGKLKQL